MDTCFRKGQVPWNKGLKNWRPNYKHSKLTKQKIGMGNTKQFCKSHINELIRKSTRFKLWRITIFERDNYTCQDCKRRSRKGERIQIHPHHLCELAKIISHYKIKNITQAHQIPILWDIDNGITLCSRCHQKRHIQKFTGFKAKKL